MQIAMIQDKIIPFDDIDPVYLDRGTFFGDGVYEVLRSYQGRIFAMDQHLQRFARSLHEIDINGIDIDNIRTRVQTAFDRADIANAKIYFHITRGSAPRNHAADQDIKPNFLLTLTELQDNSDNKINGIAVSTFPDWRWKRCDIKSLNLLANVLAKQDAEKKGCSEAILVNDNGEITEGSSSAFFMINAADKQLITRPLSHDILPSITRAFVEQIAPNAGLTLIEKPYTPKDATQADELLIAVTTQDIVPVVKFDNQTIATGQPGQYTKNLIKEFKNLLIN